MNDVKSYIADMSVSSELKTKALKVLEELGDIKDPYVTQSYTEDSIYIVMRHCSCILNIEVYETVDCAVYYRDMYSNWTLNWCLGDPMCEKLSKALEFAKV